MKNFIILSLLCFVFFKGFAQPKNATTMNDTTEAKVLEELSVTWMNAMLDHDSAALVKLMSPDFILYSWDGKSETPRERWINTLLNRLKVINWEQTSINAKVFGDMAIVNSLYKWSGTHTERQFDTSGYLTDVWMKKNNKWQVISRMSGSGIPVQVIQK